MRGKHKANTGKKLSGGMPFKWADKSGLLVVDTATDGEEIDGVTVGRVTDTIENDVIYSGGGEILYVVISGSVTFGDMLEIKGGVFQKSSGKKTVAKCLQTIVAPVAGQTCRVRLL